MNDVIGGEKLRDGSYPVLWLDPPDCPSRRWMTVSLWRNQFITQFQALLHLGWFGAMVCCSGSSLLKKNIPELFSHTWTAIWADASRLSPQSKFSEFIQLEWPFQFTAVPKIPSVCASFAIRYTYVQVYIFVHRSICISHAWRDRESLYVCVYKKTA